MTHEEKEAILSMHADGLGARRISTALGLSTDTVKSFLRRHKADMETSTSSTSARGKTIIKRVSNKEQQTDKQDPFDGRIMDDELFQRILRFHSTMSALRLILSEGMISEEEYQYFEVLLKKKYLLEKSVIYV